MRPETLPQAPQAPQAPPASRARLADAAPVLALVLGLWQAGPGMAQIVLPHPDPAIQEAAPRVPAQPPRTRAVAARGGWVLELVEPGRASGAVARSAGVPSGPPVRAGRLRLTGTPQGVSVIEDLDAAAPARAATTTPPNVTARANAAGELVQELPAGSVPPSPAREPAGVKTVDLRTPEEVMRAMADPQPLTRYRLVK